MSGRTGQDGLRAWLGRPAGRRTLRLAGFLVLLALVALARFTLLRDVGMTDVHRWVEQAGAWGPLTFVALFALAATFFLPSMPFAVAAGLLFGPWGLLWAWIGDVLGAHGAYFLARAGGGGPVRRLIDRRVPDALAGFDRSLFTLLLVRLVPVFPTNATNAACGSAKVPLGTYAVATALGVLPTVAVEALMGAFLGGQGGGKRFWLPVGGGVLAYAALLLGGAWLGRRHADRLADFDVGK